MIDRISDYTTTVMLSTNPPVREPIYAEQDFETVFAAAADNSSTDPINCPSNLEEIFEQASQTYGISLSLLKAVAKAESDFDPDCTSSSGAMGIMQLMPATAKELGVTNAYDPEQNIMAGAKYLAENLKIFDGDISLATAAYNAGRGAVEKYNGIPPYTETQNYVKKILGYLEEDITIPEIPSSQASNQENLQSPLSTPETAEKRGLTKAEKNAIRQLDASGNTYILSQVYPGITDVAEHG